MGTATKRNTDAEYTPLSLFNDRKRPHSRQADVTEGEHRQHPGQVISPTGQGEHNVRPGGTVPHVLSRL